LLLAGRPSSASDGSIRRPTNSIVLMVPRHQNHCSLAMPFAQYCVPVIHRAILRLVVMLVPTRGKHCQHMTISSHFNGVLVSAKARRNVWPARFRARSSYMIRLLLCF
jgi:hypothetical protein